MGTQQKLSVAEFAMSLTHASNSGDGGVLAGFRGEYAATLAQLQELLAARFATDDDGSSSTGSPQSSSTGSSTGSQTDATSRSFTGALIGDDALLSWPGVEHAMASSPYLVSVIERYPERFIEMLEQCRHGVPDRSKLFRLRVAMRSSARSPGNLKANAIDESDISAEEFMRELREFRHLSTAVIALFDLTGIAAVDTTLQSLSDVADVCISEALAFAEQTCNRRFGTPRDSNGNPQTMMVVGMGKLGGRELNFSSDVDLVFFYSSEGQTDGPKVVESHEYFRRAGQLLIRYIDEVTSAGFAYRVDMRLRPFGASGPLAVSLDAMENYLFTQGRDWERYAWIKARVVCGAPEDGKALEQLLRPFIYRRYLDYAVFESLRDLKRQIGLKVDECGSQLNIKLGHGGIREVEVIAQSFQLVRGGHEPALQQRSLRRVVSELAANGHLPATDAEQLQVAYDFLRQTENRLQMVDERQTHLLPTEEIQQTRLAISMCFNSYTAFSRELDQHRNSIHQLFTTVFSGTGDESERDATEDIWIRLAGSTDFLATDENAGLASTLAEAGYTDAQGLLDLLQQYALSNRYQRYQNRSRELIDSLIPKSLQLITTTEHSQRLTMQRVLALFDAVAGRSGYLQLLRDSEKTHANLVQLFSLSPWLAEFVTNHPVVLDELLDIEHASIGSSAEELLTALHSDLAHYRQSPDTDFGDLMDAVRQFKHSRMVRIAAADINGLLSVTEVSHRLSWLAEAVVAASLDLVVDELTAKHGRPGCTVDGIRFQPGIAVIAYGKLGGCELSYGSDLDLVFLHESSGDDQQTDGDKPLDNTVYFARVAQKLVNFLTTMTPAGVLYEIDTRLRPNGRAGVLVTGIQAFAAYQHNDAWTWEHQALVRARVVVGHSALRCRFRQIRSEVLSNRPASSTLRADVVEMRQRMRDELSRDSDDTFDLKQGAGGIADIEFMVQYLILSNALHEGPHERELLSVTDNISQLDALQQAGLLAAEKAALLKQAYLHLRELYHRSALSLEKPLVSVSNDVVGDSVSETTRHRTAVVECWQQIMLDS